MLRKSESEKRKVGRPRCEKRNVRLTFTTPEETAEWLRLRALERECSISAVITDIIDTVRVLSR